MSSLAQISRVKHVLDRNQLVTVINALVFSKLLYCFTVWSNTSNKNICRLQSVQNFAARIITGTRKFDHITPALRDLRFFFVIVRRETILFKIILTHPVNHQSTHIQIFVNVEGRNSRKGYKNREKLRWYALPGRYC